MRRWQFAITLCLLLATASAAFAADISGKWKATFDTQIGVQNYTYTFKMDGGKLTGTAESEHGKSALADAAVVGRHRDVYGKPELPRECHKNRLQRYDRRG